jgi:hypothetical protein
VRDELMYCGDWDYWVRLLADSDLAYVSDPLNRNRRHETTVTARMSRSVDELRERCVVLRAILTNLKPTRAEAQLLMDHFARIVLHRIRQGKARLNIQLLTSVIAPLIAMRPSMLWRFARLSGSSNAPAQPDAKQAKKQFNSGSDA